jgi:hypothetical protein
VEAEAEFSEPPKARSISPWAAALAERALSNLLGPDSPGGELAHEEKINTKTTAPRHIFFSITSILPNYNKFKNPVNSRHPNNSHQHPGGKEENPSLQGSPKTHKTAKHNYGGPCNTKHIQIDQKQETPAFTTHGNLSKPTQKKPITEPFYRSKALFISRWARLLLLLALSSLLASLVTQANKEKEKIPINITPMIFFIKLLLDITTKSTRQLPSSLFAIASVQTDLSAGSIQTSKI